MRRGNTFDAELVASLPRLRRQALKLTCHKADAEDIVHDAVCKALENRAQYQDGTNLGAWLFIIMRNVFYNGKRRAWRSVPYNDLRDENALQSENPAPYILDLAKARDYMTDLPCDQFDALTMRAEEQMSYSEIADTMGCAIGTAKSRVYRARDAMKASVIA